MNRIPSFVLLLHLRGVSASQLFLVKISVSLELCYESVDPATKQRKKKLYI